MSGKQERSDDLILDLLIKELINNPELLAKFVLALALDKETRRRLFYACYDAYLAERDAKSGANVKPDPKLL